MSHNPKLQDLCGELDRGEISRDDFVQRCTRHVAAEIGCSRAGVWLFVDTDARRELHCIGMFDANANRWVDVPDYSGPEVQDYFNALASDGHVVAVDVRTHPATAGFFDAKLRVNNVQSLLAVSFGVNGKLLGAFTCTEVGRPMEWSKRQLASLKAIGARTSLALSGATRSRRVMTTQNAEL